MHLFLAATTRGNVAETAIAGGMLILAQRFGPARTLFACMGTLAHEAMHGLAAKITGGSIQRFHVNLHDFSGWILTTGGNRLCVGLAGYLLTPGVGLLLALTPRYPWASVTTLFASGVLMLLLTRRADTWRTAVFSGSIALGLLSGTLLGPHARTVLLMATGLAIALGGLSSLTTALALLVSRPDVETDLSRLLRRRKGVLARSSRVAATGTTQ